MSGVLAALAGMAAGHLVAGVVLPAASPVLAVGSTVIRATPEPVKQWAIRTFGDADKAVLVGSVVAVVLVLAVVAGVHSRSRPAVGLAFVGVLGAATVAAALTSPSVTASGPAPIAVVAPGLVATGVAAATLLGLRGLALGSGTGLAPGHESSRRGPEGASTDPRGGAFESPLDHVTRGHVAGEPDRRRFLVGTAGVAGGALLAAAAGQRLARPGPVAGLDDVVIDSAAPPLPVGLDRRVPGITSFRTPLGEFYRVDTALTIPRVDRGGWSLVVDGDVDRRLELSFAELVGDFEVIERDVTLNCVSNEVGGPYVSSGRWVGVRTRDVLARAGVGGDVDQVLSRSHDGMTISTPLGALTDGREAMIAVGLDGEALPRERGYPARLLTPGLYGFVGATKWLVRMTATTYDADVAYWTRRDWATDAPVKTQSRIDVPRGFEVVPAGPVRIGGVAWAQRRGIERVEVRVDDGPWLDAEMGPEANVDYWRQWTCEVDLTEPGRHDLVARATDGTGEAQTEERADPFPDGASGWARVVVRVE